MRALFDADRPGIREVLADDGGFSRRVDGRGATEADVSELLAPHPAGSPGIEKQAYGLFQAQRLVAVADLALRWPTGAHAYIGLLQVRAAAHGRGCGRDLHEHLLATIAPMCTITTLRLSIVETNLDVAAPFWVALGYRATGETKPWANAQGRKLTAHLYERPVRP